MSQSIAASRASIKSIALPAEHGGWGFLFEPILLGLFAAPSAAGLLLGLAALAAFLLHQPLLIAIKDRRKGKRWARTALADRFALLYGLIGAGALALAVWIAPHRFWLPLLIAVPLGLIKLGYDLSSASRAAAAELVGALAFGALAPAIALAGGRGLWPALMLWALLAGRTIPAILYVRARLRLERGREVSSRGVGLAHLAAVIAAGVLAWRGAAPLLSVVALALLLARALWGLSPHRRRVPARVIGFSELGWGLLTVILIGLGLTPGL
ncbi:MAG: YwiC-like family protein [Anaerolineae bacterium]